MSNRQIKIDFNRGSQLRILERAVIPDPPPERRTKRIRNRGTLKSILKAIDSYQRENASCFPSIPTLAMNTGFSVRTVQRGLHRLAESGIVSISPTRRPNGSHGSNNISIEWVRLLDANPTDFSDAAVPQLGHDPSNETRRGGDNLTGGGDRLSPGWCQDVTPSKRPSERPLKRKEHVAANDVFSREERRPEPPHREPTAGKPTGRQSRVKTFWGRMQPLTRRDLTNGPTVAQLFRFAIGKGWGGLQGTERDELTFFALCQFCARKATDPNNCGRYLTYLLKEKLYGNICEQDDEAARRLLAERWRETRGVRREETNQLATAFALPSDNQPPDRRAELERRAQLERSVRPWG